MASVIIVLTGVLVFYLRIIAGTRLDTDTNCFQVYDNTKADVRASAELNVSAFHECHYWCRGHSYDQCSGYQYHSISGQCQLFDEEQTNRWKKIENQPNWALVDLKAKCYHEKLVEEDEGRVKRSQTWTPWGDWSQCSTPCGGNGLKTRSRQCGSYGGCRYGGTTDIQECAPPPCSGPKLTPWSDWCACSAPCGGGTQTRSRRCTATSYGGGGCGNENTQEARKCNDQPCAQWSPWSEWCQCSISCGGGAQSRTRECWVHNSCGNQCGGPSPCGQGGNKDNRRCNEHPCATWQPWGEWCPCSATCGGGMQVRTRQCSVPGACGGDDREDRSCNEQPCCGSTCGSTCGLPSPAGPTCAHWGQWGDWCPCTASCGGGTQLRQRLCMPPGTPLEVCPGKPMESAPCAMNPCTTVTEWTPWTPCSATCGGGTKTRTKPCQPIGPDCPGNKTETMECGTQPCSSWTEWGPWNECSVTCGMGSRTRKHYCNGELCQGNSTESQPCERGPCPSWNEWTAWTDCTVTCGNGTSSRIRTCNGTGCTGDFKEVTTCNRGPCPTWNEWVAWSDCSVTCGTGTRSRSRTCSGGNCTGNTTETEKCNRGPCPTWTEWVAWTDCSVTCGNGTRTRTRMCVLYAGTEAPGPAPSRVKRFTKIDSSNCTGNSTETEDCTDGPCPTWTPWSSWAPCPVTCGNSTQVRKRECTGNNCPGNDTDAQYCEEAPCYTWSSWSEWSECAVLCGGGSRNRTRQCPAEDECPGLDEDSDICNMMPCPDWGEWSPWTECSVSCGNGTRSRTRSCPLPEACSPGEGYEVDPVPCNPQDCPTWAEWTEWTPCSKTCGEGNRRRTRPCSSGTDCLGPSETVEPCFIKLCLLTTTWSQWSPCTATCGGGTQTRSKAACPTGPPTCSQDEETQECNPQDCPNWTDWTQWGQCSKTCGGGQRSRTRTCPIPFGCVGQPSQIDPRPCNAQGCNVVKTKTTPMPQP